MEASDYMNCLSREEDYLSSKNQPREELRMDIFISYRKVREEYLLIWGKRDKALFKVIAYLCGKLNCYFPKILTALSGSNKTCNQTAAQRSFFSSLFVCLVCLFFFRGGRFVLVWIFFEIYVLFKKTC